MADDNSSNKRQRRKLVIYSGADEIIKLSTPRSRKIGKTLKFARAEMSRYPIATHCVITDLSNKEWELSSHASLLQRLKIWLKAD